MAKRLSFDLNKPVKTTLEKGLNPDLIKKNDFDREIYFIEYTKIKPADKNRELRKISQLAEDIADAGLEQTLVVRRIDDPYYEVEIIAGHRRFAAIKLLIENGDERYRLIPCRVKNYEDTKTRERLHLSNLMGDEYTATEKIEAIIELEEIYKERKANGENIPGRICELIAEKTGLQKSQIYKYHKIGKAGTEEVLELLDKGKLTVNQAYGVSKLDKEIQKEALEDQDNIDFSYIDDLMNSKGKPKKKKKKKAEQNCYLKGVQKNIEEKIQTQVSVDDKKIVIKYLNVDDLNRILEILNLLDKSLVE